MATNWCNQRFQLHLSKEKKKKNKIKNFRTKCAFAQTIPHSIQHAFGVRTVELACELQALKEVNIK